MGMWGAGVYAEGHLYLSLLSLRPTTVLLTTTRCLCGTLQLGDARHEAWGEA